MHALCRFALVLALPFVAVAAQAQGAAVPIGSFDLAPGATDGKADCPGAGGFDDLVYALLYQLPGDDYVVNMYRRPENGGMVSMLVSKQHSCVFRRMEFHTPAHDQPGLPPPPPPPPGPSQSIPRPAR